MSIIKTRKTVCEHRYLLNMSKNSGNGMQPLRNKVKRSLQRNTHKLLLEKKLVNNKSVIDSLIDTFMKEDVIIDVVYFDTIRSNTTKAVTDVQGTYGYIANLENSSKIKYNIHNGLTNNAETRRGFNLIKQNKIPANLMIITNVSNYTANPDSIHNTHSICAFKHMDTLYCFNPWGDGYINSDKMVPDNHVWEYLRKEYMCRYIIIYSGHNFQQQDLKGACVGFSVNFGTHMWNYIFRWNLMSLLKQNIPQRTNANAIDILRYSHIPNIRTVTNAYIMHSNEFNQFVLHLFTTYIGAFGDQTYIGPNKSINGVFAQLTSNKETTKIKNNHDTSRPRKQFWLRNGPLQNNSNLDEPDLSGIILNSIYNVLKKNNITFKKHMYNSGWWNNNSLNNQQRTARQEVRRILRTLDPTLVNVNGNIINGEIKKYANSGNLSKSSFRG